MATTFTLNMSHVSGKTSVDAESYSITGPQPTDWVLFKKGSKVVYAVRVDSLNSFERTDQ